MTSRYLNVEIVAYRRIYVKLVNALASLEDIIVFENANEEPREEPINRAIMNEMLKSFAAFVFIFRGDRNWILSCIYSLHYTTDKKLPGFEWSILDVFFTLNTMILTVFRLHVTFSSTDPHVIKRSNDDASIYLIA